LPWRVAASPMSFGSVLNVYGHIEGGYIRWSCNWGDQLTGEARGRTAVSAAADSSIDAWLHVDIRMANIEADLKFSAADLRRGAIIRMIGWCEAASQNWLRMEARGLVNLRSKTSDGASEVR